MHLSFHSVIQQTFIGKPSLCQAFWWATELGRKDMALAFKDPTLHWEGLHSEQSLPAPQVRISSAHKGSGDLNATYTKVSLGVSPWYPCLT